ncbi:MAG: mechanosensitive ion channel [Thermodesulfobacteriota bacterium]|nr:mechanosensitive ion channel [Thermodesulfobacteriota bacterium]
MPLSIFSSIFRNTQPVFLFFASIFFLAIPLNSYAVPLPFAVSHSAQSTVTSPEKITATAEQSRETVTDLSNGEEASPVFKKSFFSKQTLAHLQVSLEQFIQVFYWRMVALDANSAKVPYDLSKAMNKLSFGNGVRGFMKMFGLLVVIFALAGVAEYFFRRLLLSRITWHDDPEDSVSNWQRFWAVFLRTIPDLVGILFFIGASYVGYVLIYAAYFSGICPIYLSLLIAITIARLISLVSHMFFAPEPDRTALIPLKQKTAALSHYSITISGWIITLGIMSLTLFKHAGVHGDSLLLLKMGFGTLITLLIAIVILTNRKTVARNVFTMTSDGNPAGVQGYLAANWHIMALGYLLLLWMFWLVRLIVVGPQFTLAFAVSLFIVPIFLLLDRLVIGFFRSLFNPEPSDEGSADDTNKDEIAPSFLLPYLLLISRLLLIGLLGLWILSLWGYPVAFSDAVIDKGLEILFTLLVAFFLWKVIDLFIRNHLKNKELAQAAEEDVDSEWGDAPLLDRSQTLLPVVRKFIGITMVVMTIMLILSVLGVNIGPLLAGAGVVGIAIGFGAQKLVSDVLSGLFYLLDDAFRVGEYIEAGSITGAVEKITLRNVMLRHHRGMLQIVPYSDLGAITNYMRGGIVVKFNLQFPYDTDVDVVRKVIKRVGIAMLDDPEFGKNFIKQVKSQGIREVGDSILTIRVKFTAKPGTHFLIRREAYRRITDALAAKGIHYAHRKVIVEVPPIAGNADADSQEQPIDDETKKRIAQAGAAAQQIQQQGRTEG